MLSQDNRGSTKGPLPPCPSKPSSLGAITPSRLGYLDSGSFQHPGLAAHTGTPEQHITQRIKEKVGYPHYGQADGNANSSLGQHRDQAPEGCGERHNRVPRSCTSPCIPAASLPLPPFPPELATYWYTHLPHRATVLPEFPHLFLITS